MGNGWREAEWKNVYANPCHLQDKSWTGLRTTSELPFKDCIPNGRSPFRRIIPIPSLSHSDLQSNRKSYLRSPSLRESVMFHQHNVDVEKIRISPWSIMTMFASGDVSQSPHSLLCCLFLCPTQLNLD